MAASVSLTPRFTPIDEICECGRLMSQHGLGADGKTPNRGPAGDCPKFEFAGFVFADELQVPE